MLSHYEIIVVGAGHAGCEAALAAARLGSKVLLITMKLENIAQMSCNPAMGGIAKGQIIREIDALGGNSGIIADKTMIQFRMLNKSKGPAMWSPRTQNDKMLFAQQWRLALEDTKNLDLWQDTVTEVIVKNGKAVGVKALIAQEIYAKAVILTNGTFLNGNIHIGERQFGGGRSGEKASYNITEQLMSLGFTTGRMKTGTSPRLDSRTIDYSKMEQQKGDDPILGFSFTEIVLPKTQKSCYITYTNPAVHSIIASSLNQSPLFNGAISGIGPRYCPSIEDKVSNFASKDRHQIFIEPEGWNTVETYVNGFSTSLPLNVQYAALQKIEGLENAKILRPGYAIEYDYFLATQLHPTLETHIIENLYFAGQINGTTGYEEAACQGLVAGINANRKIYELEAFILSRTNSYIGVLIDDLTTKETIEPYRMFTSRAEFRIVLRQDNADLRLTPIGYKLGLASQKRIKKVNDKQVELDTILAILRQHKIQPEKITAYNATATIQDATSANKLIKRPELSIEEICIIDSTLKSKLQSYSQESLLQAEIQIKYESYIIKEQEAVAKATKLEEYKIPPQFNYNTIVGISAEAKEKLIAIKPITIGQASNISGVSPADISILLTYMGR